MWNNLNNNSSGAEKNTTAAAAAACSGQHQPKDNVSTPKLTMYSDIQLMEEFTSEIDASIKLNTDCDDRIERSVHPCSKDNRLVVKKNTIRTSVNTAKMHERIAALMKIDNPHCVKVHQGYRSDSYIMVKIDKCGVVAPVQLASPGFPENKNTTGKWVTNLHQWLIPNGTGRGSLLPNQVGVSTIKKWMRQIILGLAYYDLFIDLDYPSLQLSNILMRKNDDDKSPDVVLGANYFVHSLQEDRLACHEKLITGNDGLNFAESPESIKRFYKRLETFSKESESPHSVEEPRRQPGLPAIHSFNIGCILYILTYLRPPFSSHSVIANCTYFFPHEKYPERYDKLYTEDELKNVKRIILQSLVEEPAKRATLLELLTDDWLFDRDYIRTEFYETALTKARNKKNPSLTASIASAASAKPHEPKTIQLIQEYHFSKLQELKDTHACIFIRHGKTNLYQGDGDLVYKHLLNFNESPVISNHHRNQIISNINDLLIPLPTSKKSDKKDYSEDFLIELINKRSVTVLKASENSFTKDIMITMNKCRGVKHPHLHGARVYNVYDYLFPDGKNFYQPTEKTIKIWMRQLFEGLACYAYFFRKPYPYLSLSNLILDHVLEKDGTESEFIRLGACTDIGHKFAGMIFSNRGSISDIKPTEEGLYYSPEDVREMIADSGSYTSQECGGRRKKIDYKVFNPKCLTSNIWSAGVCLYVMVSGVFPFYGKTPLSDIQMSQFDNKKIIYEKAKGLISTLLCPKAERITLLQALTDSWLMSDLKYEDLDKCHKAARRMTLFGQCRPIYLIMNFSRLKMSVALNEFGIFKNTNKYFNAPPSPKENISPVFFDA